MNRSFFKPKFTKTTLSNLLNDIEKLSKNKLKQTLIPLMTDQPRLHAKNENEKEAYIKARNHLINLEAQPLTESLIKQLNNIATEAKSYDYRNYDVEVKNNDARVYRAADYTIISREILGLLRWVNKSNIDTLIIAGIFHYKFVKIHPFANGNGRTARLICSKILNKDYNHDICLEFENYFPDNLIEYYNALDNSSKNKQETYDNKNKTDLTTWLEYFCNAFYNTLLKFHQK